MRALVLFILLTSPLAAVDAAAAKPGSDAYVKELQEALDEVERSRASPAAKAKARRLLQRELDLMLQHREAIRAGNLSEAARAVEAHRMFQLERAIQANPELFQALLDEERAALEAEKARLERELSKDAQPVQLELTPPSQPLLTVSPRPAPSLPTLDLDPLPTLDLSRPPAPKADKPTLTLAPTGGPTSGPSAPEGGLQSLTLRKKPTATPAPALRGEQKTLAALLQTRSDQQLLSRVDSEVRASRGRARFDALMADVDPPTGGATAGSAPALRPARRIPLTLTRAQLEAISAKAPPAMAGPRGPVSSSYADIQAQERRNTVAGARPAVAPAERTWGEWLGETVTWSWTAIFGE